VPSAAPAHCLKRPVIPPAVYRLVEITMTDQIWRAV